MQQRDLSPTRKPVDLSSFLCLRCSTDSKWQLFYCALALDCDTPILEALFFTSFCYESLRSRSQAPLLAEAYYNLLLSHLAHPRFNSYPRADGSSGWVGPGNMVFILHKQPNWTHDDFIISLDIGPYGGKLTKTIGFLLMHDLRYFISPTMVARPFKVGEFSTFINIVLDHIKQK